MTTWNLRVLAAMALILAQGSWIDCARAKPEPAAGPKVTAQAQAPAPVMLPAPDRVGTRPLEGVLAQRRSIRTLSGQPIPLEALSQLLWAAQGISDDQGRRTTPSARATYPLDVLAVVSKVPGVAPGIFRYDPAGHALIPMAAGDRLKAFVNDVFGQAWALDAAVILVVTATPERARAKMGDRAGRFAGLEAGLASQNTLLQVTALGLGSTFVGGFDPDKAAAFLGLPPGETAHAILPIGVPTNLTGAAFH